MDFKSIRPLDGLGRVVIPSDFRKLYGINLKDKVVITATDKGIVITKHEEQ